jgi:hypothetical protein
MNHLFQEALETGRVVVRRWWPNTNSSNNQVTVQFFQLVQTGDGKPNLIAIAQGVPTGNIVSALFSFNADVVEHLLGSTEGSFVEEGQPVYGDDLFGTEVNIQVTENFIKNPYAKKQEPKLNPSTGEVVMATNPETNQMEPVYRHTELVAGIPYHSFVRPIQPAAVASPVQTELTKAGGAFGSIAER